MIVDRGSRGNSKMRERGSVHRSKATKYNGLARSVDAVHGDDRMGLEEE